MPERDAYPGTIPTIGVNNKANRNKPLVTKEANSVLAPAEIPAADSANDVTVLVPKTAQISVEDTSTCNILFKPLAPSSP